MAENGSGGIIDWLWRNSPQGRRKLRAGWGMPQSIRQSYIAQPHSGRPVFPGTSVPIIGSFLTKSELGLWLPGPRSRQNIPADALTTFLTAQDILGRPLQLHEVAAALQEGSPAGFLIALAGLLAPIETTNVLDRDTQRQLARSLLGGAALNRTLGAIDEGRVFLAPQVLLVAMKTALVMSNSTRSGPIPSWAALILIFSHAEMLGAVEEQPGHRWQGFPANLSLEVVRNQNFNRSSPLASTVARYWRLWHELPVECDVPDGQRPVDDFRAEAGCSPEQLALFGLWCWMSASMGQHVLSPDMVGQIPIEDGAKDAAMRLTAATVEELAVDVAAQSVSDGIPWAFLAFRRRPLARLQNGFLLVISPRFLGERVFGDAIFWELTERNNRLDAGAPNSPHWNAFRNLHAKCVERYVEEVLESWRPADGGVKRAFTEEDMNAAWGAGVRVCDMALDYDWAWLAVEVVSRRFGYGAATGGDPATLDREIAAAVEAKAEQVHSAIEQLRNDPTSLSGRQPNHPLRFFPVVAVAHGFPTNPVTLEVIRQNVQAKGLLQADDTAPLELLDLEELDFLDAVREQLGLSAVQMLRDKHNSPFFRSSIMDYLMIDRGLEPDLCRRLRAAYERAIAAAVAASNDPTLAQRAARQGGQDVA